MPLTTTSLKAVLFDYGSTLIEFSHPQIAACDTALAELLQKLYGPMDKERFRTIRLADRIAPYNDSYRENDVPGITRALIRSLYNVEIEEGHLREILKLRFDAFVLSITPTPGADTLIAKLRERYRVGLISNYPNGDAIRASVKRVGLSDLLEIVVTSGDVGWVKPHPLPFTTALEQLGIEAHEAVYIGDNWLADIQGAKGLGMQAILTRQFVTPERFDPKPGDVQPDATINHFSELEALLLTS